MKILQLLIYKILGGFINMSSFIMLYAINIVENGYSYSKVPAVLKPKVKEQIILMVGSDNTEIIDQLLAS